MGRYRIRLRAAAPAGDSAARDFGHQSYLWLSTTLPFWVIGTKMICGS
jgi:hypothetical protein